MLDSVRQEHQNVGHREVNQKKQKLSILQAKIKFFLIRPTYFAALLGGCSPCRRRLHIEVKRGKLTLGVISQINFNIVYQYRNFSSDEPKNFGLFSSFGLRFGECIE